MRPQALGRGRRARRHDFPHSRNVVPDYIDIVLIGADRDKDGIENAERLRDTLRVRADRRRDRATAQSPRGCAMSDEPDWNDKAAEIGADGVRVAFDASLRGPSLPCPG